jgi:gamma-glutamylcyclotransferase (GGCT)/AIG2-like uncharacterized protein YtfP
MGPAFREHTHVFVYGTLLQGQAAAGLMDGCVKVRPATVAGALYDIDGRYPALLLAGAGTVHGEIWRCPADRIYELDRYEEVDAGLFRRVGSRVDGVGCWVYVAGPALGPKLTPQRRIASGRWRVADRRHA